MKKKKLSKMVDAKLPGLIDERMSGLLDEKLPNSKLSENEEVRFCWLNNEILEHSSRLHALEVDQEDVQMVSVCTASIVGLVVAIIISGLTAIILGNIMYNLRKDVDNMQDVVVIDTSGHIMEGQSNFAVMIDDAGQATEVLPMVDFEKMMKDTGVRQSNVEYDCGELSDYYSVCVYLRGGYSSKKSGSVTFSKNTLSEVAEVKTFVHQKKASGDGREILVDKHFQYYDKILDSGEALRQRFNWGKGYLEMEDATTMEYVVLRVSSHSFLISQEEYEALWEALKMLQGRD